MERVLFAQGRDFDFEGRCFGILMRGFEGGRVGLLGCCSRLGALVGEGSGERRFWTRSWLVLGFRIN